ncbi:MAG: group 1 truncated hemoglobin [Verrucomicrobiota bacterium]
MPTQSLYERVGGEAGVTRLIGIFYDRVLADPQLSPFFAHIPMEKLRSMQVEFFTSALGGPLQYSGRPLAHVHHGHGITKAHLRRFTEHLLASLESLALSRQDIQGIYTRIALEADDVTEDADGLGSGCEAG